MVTERVAVAADHAGADLKAALSEVLRERGYEVLDLGTNGPESVDYPDFAAKLAAALAEGQASRGVLVCGTGIGISIAANRYPAHPGGALPRRDGCTPRTAAQRRQCPCAWRTDDRGRNRAGMP